MKLIITIDECVDCPHYYYRYNDGFHSKKCLKVYDGIRGFRRIDNSDIIQEWCPLNSKKEILNKKLNKIKMKTIKEYFTDLHDNFIHYMDNDNIVTDDSNESLYCLMNDIFICMINFDEDQNWEEEIKKEEYIKEMSNLYILKKSGEIITLDKLIPLMYLDLNKEYHLRGDEDYID